MPLLELSEQAVNSVQKIYDRSSLAGASQGECMPLLELSEQAVNSVQKIYDRSSLPRGPDERRTGFSVLFLWDFLDVLGDSKSALCCFSVFRAAGTTYHVQAGATRSTSKHAITPLQMTRCVPTNSTMVSS